MQMVSVVNIIPRRGFALRDAIFHSQAHSVTALGAAVHSLQHSVKADRLIIITDEQSPAAVPAPTAFGRGYIINVASNQNGVGYGQWIEIDGWSEAVLSYIAELERTE